LPRRPQPVPPIYQPEVAARGIVYASEHPRRREYWIGASTALTLMGNAVAPGVLDRYLGRTGFDSQQTDQAEPAHRPDNLWAPVDRDRDYGAHGTFDDRSTRHSAQEWASHHHGLLAGIAGAAAAAGTVLMRRGRR
jgi:hypothetical protein